MAFDLIHGTAVEQLEAVEGAVLQPARANPPLKQLRARDAGARAGRQGGRLGSLLEASHAQGGSTNRIAAEKLFSPVKAPHGRLHLWTDCVSKPCHKRDREAAAAAAAAALSARVMASGQRRSESIGHFVKGEGGQQRWGEVGPHRAANGLRGPGI